MTPSRLLPLCLLSLLAGSPGTARGQAVSELYVAPDTVRLAEGERQGLAVQAFDSAGNVVLAVGFRSIDEEVARVSSSGTVSALRAGRTQVVVAAGKKIRTVPVVVRAAGAEKVTVAANPDVALLLIEPLGLSLLPTEHARLTVKAARVDGSPTSAAGVTWRALRPEVATVSDSTGTVTAVSTGRGVIQAVAANGVTATIPVAVSLSEFVLSTTRLHLSLRETATLTATVPAQGNRRLVGEDLQWSSSNPSVAQVTAAGLVRAVGPGVAEISVRGFLQEHRVAVVIQPDVARFLTRPRLADTIRVPVGAEREFRLELQADDSTPIGGIPVQWSLSDSSVASFDSGRGVLLARAAGTTTLTFAVRGFLPKGWTVEVVPGDLGLDRSAIGLRVGESTQLSAAYVDDRGHRVLTADGANWLAVGLGVARVMPNGTVTGLSPGRARVTASLPGGKSTGATVFVTGDLLVTSDRGGRYGIYQVIASRPDSFLPLVVDTGSNNLDGTLSPDRTRLLFVSDRAAVGNYDIFVADADGARPVRLTTDASAESQPVWTPDGRIIVFVSGRTGTKQIWAMDADGGHPRVLTSFPGGAEDPVVSPDGRLVAVSATPDTRSEPNIYLLPLAGGPATRVSEALGQRERRPFWLAQGQLGWVVAGRDKKSPDLVVRQTLGEGPAVPLVASERPLVDVALSRDATRLAWVTAAPAKGNRGQASVTFQWRSLKSGKQTSIRLRPGERITSPAF